MPRNAQPAYQFLNPFNPSSPPHYSHAHSDDLITRQEFLPYNINPQIVIQQQRHDRQGRQLPWAAPGQRPIVGQPRSPIQNRNGPAEDRHTRVPRTQEVLRGQQLYINSAQLGHNNGQHQQTYANANPYDQEYQAINAINVNNLAADLERVRGMSNLHNLQSVTFQEHRVNPRRIPALSAVFETPESVQEFISNATSTELENIYCLRYPDEPAPRPREFRHPREVPLPREPPRPREVPLRQPPHPREPPRPRAPPPPPPPRQLTRVPFHIINDHHFYPDHRRDDMQRILNRAHHQDFVRDMAPANANMFWHRKPKDSTNYCYGCSVRFLLFLSTIVVGVGLALILASFYVAGLM